MLLLMLNAVVGSVMCVLFSQCSFLLLKKLERRRSKYSRTILLLYNIHNAKGCVYIPNVYIVKGCEDVVVVCGGCCATHCVLFCDCEIGGIERVGVAQ